MYMPLLAFRTRCNLPPLGLHNACLARTKLRLISAILEEVPQRDEYRISQAARVTEMVSER